jgi:hypothetical protein
VRGWDVETVRLLFRLSIVLACRHLHRLRTFRAVADFLPFLPLEQGALLGTPFKAHERAILWTSHHTKEQQLITAGADGAVKVWGA